MNYFEKYLKYILIGVLLLTSIVLYSISRPVERIAYAACGGTYTMSSGYKTCNADIKRGCLVTNGAVASKMTDTCGGPTGNCICSLNYAMNTCLYKGILGCGRGNISHSNHAFQLWGDGPPCQQCSCGSCGSGPGGPRQCDPGGKECDYTKTPPKCNDVPPEEPSCELWTWQIVQCLNIPKPATIVFSVACQWVPEGEATPKPRGGPGEPPEEPPTPIIHVVPPATVYHWNARDVDPRLATVVIQFTIENYDPSYGTEAIVWITTPTGERYSSYMFPPNRGANSFELNGEVAQAIESTDNSMCPNHADRDCFGTTLGHLMWGGSKSSDAIGQWSARVSYQGADPVDVYWNVYSDLPYEP